MGEREKRRREIRCRTSELSIISKSIQDLQQLENDLVRQGGYLTEGIAESAITLCWDPVRNKYCFKIIFKENINLTVQFRITCNLGVANRSMANLFPLWSCVFNEGTTTRVYIALQHEKMGTSRRQLLGSF